MAVLRERIESRLGIDDAFAFVADFANAQRWDPGVAESVALDAGPLRVGSRYRLGVRIGGRVAPMEYEITRFESPNRVVLTGKGSGVRAVDDISFTSTASGTRIDYVADIRLQGLLALVTPLAARALRRIGENARDGMQRTLDELASERSSSAATSPDSVARA